MIILTMCRRVLRNVVRLAFTSDRLKHRRKALDNGVTSSTGLPRRRTTSMMATLIAYAATFAILTLAHQLYRRHGLAIYLPLFKFATTHANVFNDSSLDRDVPGGCDEKEVSRAARLLASSLNTTADPCKDFHSYVCSGFKRIVRTSLLDDMETNVTTTIYSFFHRIPRGVGKSLPEALIKAVEFYASCVKPVHTIGRTHALASFFKEQDFSFHTKIDGFLETTLELQLRLGLQIFFTLVMDPYPRFQETSRYVYLGSSRIFEEWKRARKLFVQEWLVRQVRERGNFRHGIRRERHLRPRS
ncbi:hypothetical protein MTO96_044804 [Rhipicephalus appendiculatus]